MAKTTVQREPKVKIYRAQTGSYILSDGDAWSTIF